ncbi:protein of unknown function (DUF4471) [Carpediemonas membranifera]|uniref:DUF4470 domain-containing protein n=1 Tax=Carpediemonas membranifera TaxID=201153 RepID=A0A8J6E188_9EUKA|nr:protein of unknown function (DUF4471) [Carpediemonas membranifera]|eukprot:KAG9396039.1 protein of unknown function (DUF4471) [Carpediemonas membranifera]
MKIDGMGTFPLYGLCPGIPLESQADISALLVNTGDPRYVLQTMCSWLVQKQTTALKFVLCESSALTMARQLLLLFMLFDKTEDPTSRAVAFNDLHANARMSDISLFYTKQCAAKVLDALSGRTELFPVLARFPDTKARGSVEEQLKAIVEQPGSDTAFDERLRRHYGERYQAIPSLADWEYEMRLKPMHDIVFGKHYSAWRATGIGYDHAYVAGWAGDLDNIPPQFLKTNSEGTIYELKHPNPTLDSQFKENIGRETVTTKAYLGDILTGPFLSFGVTPVAGMPDDELELLIKRQQGNGPTGTTVPTYCSMHVAFAAVRRAMMLADEAGAEVLASLSVVPFIGRPAWVDFGERTRRDDTAPPLLNKSSFRKHKFTHIILPAVYAIYMTDDLFTRACDNRADVIVESPRYLFDLTKNQQTALSAKVNELATGCGVKIDSSMTGLIKKDGEGRVVVDPEMTRSHLRFVWVAS